MRFSKTPAVAFALLATGLSLVWLSKQGKDGGQPGPAAASSTSAAAPVSRPQPEADPLAAAFESLRGKPTPEEARRSLSQMRLALEAMPKDEAVAHVRGFLAKGQDRGTGLDFAIDRDGKLNGWPSMRTFLLDALLGIDPAAAAALGREVLAKPTAADEWALALRNVAKGEERQDRSFLLSKTTELIANPGWQADPSIGYLNAFDVLVHVEATEATPLLSSLIQRKDRKDLAHAGFLTLDRLVQREPVDELTRLAADRALQQSRPEMVAQQFARADLRDPAQQSLVRNWLLDPARTGTELRSFAGVFPNNSRFISNNLLTTESAPSGAELAVHDREVLAVVSGWAADPAFTPVKDHLNAMISRLDGFVGTRKGSTPAPE